MSSPRITIKRISVEEQHEQYVTEIKTLKKENDTLMVEKEALLSENEALKKIIKKLTFQTSGTTRDFLHSQKLNEIWEQVDP